MNPSHASKLFRQNLFFAFIYNTLGILIAGVFRVDGDLVPLPISSTPATVAGLPANTIIWTERAYSNPTPGVHTFSVTAYQSDGQVVSANGNLEVVAIHQRGRRAKNIIFLLGDGMGIAHRTAARIMVQGVAHRRIFVPHAGQDDRHRNHCGRV